MYEPYEALIVNDNPRASTTEVIHHVNLLRYRERLHLSYLDAINEPYEEIQRAFLIWELEAKHDKLKPGTNN